MPTPDTQDQTLWGPINAQRKKADLDAIAQALRNILRPKSKDNRTVVARKINEHLKQNPGLAKEKRFQGLFSYRRDKEAERGAPKSSAEKEAEVELEASKTAKQTTGALKTLVDQDIARDPPARTARLNGRFTRSSAPAKATTEDSSGEEESSPEPVSELPSTLRTPITSTEPESMNLDEFEVSNATSSADSGAAFPETPKKALHARGVTYNEGSGWVDRGAVADELLGCLCAHLFAVSRGGRDGGVEAGYRGRKQLEFRARLWTDLGLRIFHHFAIFYTTRDTKLDELLDVRTQLLEAQCVRAKLVDVGRTPSTHLAIDIKQSSITATSPSTDPTESGDSPAPDILSARAGAILASVASAHDIHGLIALGGPRSRRRRWGVGGFRALPLGFPKLLMSTMAAGPVRPGQDSDEPVVYSVTDVARSTTSYVRCSRTRCSLVHGRDVRSSGLWLSACGSTRV
ncbi:hypothetical protein LXA43DRAFT_1185490 [Ganoderma leucocontextum]|nr:hypothetical protein LXA43DRAFT_1185490 [Ganoderma leucocontextum]